jgi:hypothetical protein
MHTEAMAARARASELDRFLAQSAPAESLAWLGADFRDRKGDFARGEFFGRYAGVKRRFPDPLRLAPNAVARLKELGFHAPERLSAAELARARLLLAAFEALPAADHPGLATEVFRRGDNLERSALLRALPLLPGAERCVELAIEACRTHVLDVFAAIACDNPFPARYFPELNFNQLVIKALFLDLPLERIVDWRARANAELRRIAHDYEAERRAAGRSVPDGIATIKATEPA